MATLQRRRLILGAIAPAATVLHRSTFTAADGTALASYTPDVGTGWTVNNGSPTIASNALPVNNMRATVDAGRADTRTETTMTLLASNTPDILAHWVDGANQNFIRMDEAANTATIWKRVANAATLLASGSINLVAATPYRVAVVCSGTNITVFVDGVQVVTTPAATEFAAITRFGLGNSFANSPVFDNFIITT